MGNGAVFIYLYPEFVFIIFYVYYGLCILKPKNVCVKAHNLKQLAYFLLYCMKNVHFTVLKVSKRNIILVNPVSLAERTKTNITVMVNPLLTSLATFLSQ